MYNDHLTFHAIFHEYWGAVKESQLITLKVFCCSNSSASKVPKRENVSVRDVDLQLTSTDLDLRAQNDVTFNALVSTEELLAQIGLAREFATDGKVEHPYVDKLKRVQMILFDLSHAISKPMPGKNESFESKHINDLEEWIAEYANQLPPQETYIIPVMKHFCVTFFR